MSANHTRVTSSGAIDSSCRRSKAPRGIRGSQALMATPHNAASIFLDRGVARCCYSVVGSGAGKSHSSYQSSNNVAKEDVEIDGYRSCRDIYRVFHDVTEGVFIVFPSRQGPENRPPNFHAVFPVPKSLSYKIMLPCAHQRFEENESDSTNKYPSWWVKTHLRLTCSTSG